MSNFRTEFPDFNAADMPAIPAGFVDQSWHNDACPSFRNEERHLTLYIDYANPDQREFPDCVRFSVVREDYDGTDADRAHLAETDDWEEVLAAIEAA